MASSISGLLASHISYLHHSRTTADQTTDHGKPISFPGPHNPTWGWPQGSANPRLGEGLTKLVARLSLPIWAPHRDSAGTAPCPTEPSNPHPQPGCTPALLAVQRVNRGLCKLLLLTPLSAFLPQPMVTQRSQIKATR